MKTLKQYAVENGVSYESVRKIVSRHEGELSDHLVMVGRTRHIDEDGERLLNVIRNQNAIIYPVSGLTEKVSELEVQNAALMQEIVKLQSQLLGSREEIISLQRKLLQITDNNTLQVPESHENNADNETHHEITKAATEHYNASHGILDILGGLFGRKVK